MENFINGRSMARAHDVRTQLEGLLKRMDIDTTESCGPGETSPLESPCHWRTSDAKLVGMCSRSTAQAWLLLTLGCLLYVQSETTSRVAWPRVFS
jgi:hypothetical protein